ncbi:MAG: endonuclease MutS2 [Clostridia bacterium]|nr:endonuclease MutS2 [Clostridia bacterium]
MISERSIHILELDRIKDRLLSYAVSDMGREAVHALAPVTALEEADRMLRETQEAESIYWRLGHTPLDSFADMRGSLRRMGAVLFLSMGELLSICQCLRVSRCTREAILGGNDQGNEELLCLLANRLIAQPEIENEINRCILSEEEMADNASPELSRIRRQMKLTQEKVRDKLNSIIRTAGDQKLLQDAIITVRNGRYTIPVKAEHRRQIPGLIHDQSGTGQTLFIEPAAVVELGNEYKKLELDEKKEMERILSGLTALLQPFSQELYDSLIILARLDAIFSKAALAREYGGTRPKLNDQGRIRLINARHPLIDKEKVVPITLWLGEDFDTLIVTGPNTGGKTVTVKTVGLFTLMAMCGLFLPAQEGSEVSTFDQVFADIGDEQSIEQSLSTFSAHMTNLVSILDQADNHTLVLLDELGAGTDPLEGAALAQAILEHLQQLGCRTMATTHYSEIKAFALSREGMQNASMEFDVDRLCPTYRLYIGIPGKSNAFEISARLGLQPEVIDRARQFLKKEDAAFEDVLSGAQEQRHLAEEARHEAQLALWEAQKLKTDLEKQTRKLEEEKVQLRNKAREDARDIVRQTRKEMERLIAELRDIKNIDYKALERAIQQSRDAMRASENDLADTPLPEEGLGSAPKSVQAGESYYVTSIHNNATVLKAPDGRGMVQIQAGVIKMNVPVTDLRQVPKGQKKRAPVQDSKPILQDIQQMKMELDLRGMTVDDGILEIDRYIDMCQRSGRKEFNVIHGKGTGALRAGVQAYLKNHPKVKTYRLGAYGEGDAGVTVVTLK